MANISLQEWIRRIADEKSAIARRREQLAFKVATYVLNRAKYYVKRNFGRGSNKSARLKGRSGALMRSLELDRLGEGVIVVSAGGPGVPYAAIHEEGTVGAGGERPSIVPKPPRQWLTIPLKDQYVGRRAPEFAGKLFFVRAGSNALLLERKGGEAAYLLVRRTDIKARPYLAPAAADAAKNETIMAQVKEVYGQSSLPFEVTKV